MILSKHQMTVWLNRLTAGLSDELSEKEQGRIAQSFLLISVTHFFSKFADLLASPKITLTWLLQALGAPAFAISLLVPIRESGSMLPQVFFATYVNSRDRKVRTYQLGAAIQGVAIAGIIASALFASGWFVGVLVVSMVAVFSFGRCLSSLASKAVLGSAIPKSLRGQTTGWSATLAGLSSCLVAIYLLTQGTTQSVFSVVWLLLVALLSWILALLVFGGVKESAQKSPNKSVESKTIVEKLTLLRSDKSLLRFVLVRALLMSSALVTPYYILLAGEGSSTLQVLGGLLLASGLAKLVSSIVWGRLSDLSARTALMLSGSLVFIIGAITVLFWWLSPGLLVIVWVFPVLYFALEIAHQGVRVARKTYIVDLATEDTRVDYVAISNSFIGVLLLVSGVFLGLMSIIVEPIWLVFFLSVVSLGGAALAVTLKEL